MLDNKEYLLVASPFGLGTLVDLTEKVIPLAVSRGLKVILDLRLSRFWNSIDIDPSEKEDLVRSVLMNIEPCSDVLLLDLMAIDEIYQNQSDRILVVQSTPDDDLGELLCLPWLQRATFEDMIGRNRSDQSNCLRESIFNHLCFTGSLLERYQQLQTVVLNCIGVHARLGNGEVYLKSSSPVHHERMDIFPGVFFGLMEQHDHEFFVCSDTEDFIHAAKIQFPNRVVSPQREFPAQGFGGGHNVDSLVQTFEQENIDHFEYRKMKPDQLLLDGLLEIRLLGECKSLICSNSTMTAHARHTNTVPATVLDGGSCKVPFEERIEGNIHCVHQIPIDFSLIRSLIRSERPCIFEIGSNSGFHTRRFLETFPKGAFYCFEPDPRAIRRFRNTVGEPANLTLFEGALGAADGTHVFYQSNGWNNEEQKRYLPDGWDLSGSLLKPKEHLNRFEWCTFDSEIDVQVCKLDTFCRQKDVKQIDFIWMDVQGAEAAVFEGAAETLSSVEFIYTEYANVELYQGQKTLDELLAQLPDFKVLIRYPGDVLLWNSKYPVPESFILNYHLSLIHLQKVLNNRAN